MNQVEKIELKWKRKIMAGPLTFIIFKYFGSILAFVTYLLALYTKICLFLYLYNTFKKICVVIIFYYLQNQILQEIIQITDIVAIVLITVSQLVAQYLKNARQKKTRLLSFSIYFCSLKINYILLFQCDFKTFYLDVVY